jgi:hypothetical protein
MAEGKRIAISFGSYNPRRYSRPWIAHIVAWHVGQKPELEFGHYCGDDDGGEVEILAYPGTIIRYGQRDGRRLDMSINRWGVVKDDCSVRDIKQTEARALFVQRPKCEFTPSPMPKPLPETEVKRRVVEFTPSPMAENVFPEKRTQPRLVKGRDGCWIVESDAQKEAV